MVFTTIRRAIEVFSSRKVILVLDKVYTHFEKFPEWSYETGGDIKFVDISADGQYIVSSSYDDKINLFKSGNSTPLWSYDVGDYNIPVSISADGEYISNWI